MYKDKMRCFKNKSVQISSITAYALVQSQVHFSEGALTKRLAPERYERQLHDGLFF